MTTPTPQTELDGFIIVSPEGKMLRRSLYENEFDSWRHLWAVTPKFSRIEGLGEMKEAGYTCQPVKIVRTG